MDRIVERDTANGYLEVILDLFLDLASAVPMSEGKSAVNLRLI